MYTLLVDVKGEKGHAAPTTACPDRSPPPISTLLKDMPSRMLVVSSGMTTGCDED
jgi:hypothetical protein